jgi:N-acetylglucosamine malate deacetylase 2
MQTLTRKEFVFTLAAVPMPKAVPEPPKVLLVFAHPDDESVVAATVYRWTHELGVIVDHAVITNGEGGYRYSKLAEAVYGAALTDEATGRSRLPEIRRQETIQAGRILGIRHHLFLKQKDARFTLDTNEALDRLWDTSAVVSALADLLRQEHYDAVITLQPEPSTHGHHKAAAQLVLRAAAGLPEADRPAVLGAANDGLPAQFFVSRSTAFGYDGALDYSIVVNWVIAEHKSQGLLQRDCNRFDRELFTSLQPGSTESEQTVRQLFQRLTTGKKS